MADAKGPSFNPLDDLKVLLFFFVILWLFWFISGGPARYEVAQKPFLRPPITSDYDGIWRDPNTGEQYGEIPTTKIKANISRRVTSPRGYRPFEKPIISLSKGLANSSGMSYLKIDFSKSNKGLLNVTGLLIRDIFGKSVTLKGGSALPYQGRINKEAEVSVEPGSVLYVIDGFSPIGVSFRVNKCIGILTRFQTFYPSLPFPFPEGIDQNLTYNNCVELHKGDTDFYKNDWRVYLGIKEKIWGETGDVVRLIDHLGNTLASLFY